MTFTRTLIRASTLKKSAPALKRLPVLSRAIHNSPYRLSAGDPYPLPLSREVEQQRAQPQGGVESAESSALNTTTEEEWPMPQPLDRTGEKVDTLRARLVYQARKRGMLEGDLLLSTFARDNLATMSHEELLQFDKVSLVICLVPSSSQRPSH
jgi:succinate dehydrogenase assembly factor 2